jgi:hypothetical protein
LLEHSAALTLQRPATQISPAAQRLLSRQPKAQVPLKSQNMLSEGQASSTPLQTKRHTPSQRTVWVVAAGSKPGHSLTSLQI